MNLSRFAVAHLKAILFVTLVLCVIGGILIGEAVSSVRDAVLIGAELAVLVLLLFLGDWRATLVTGAIIPATVLITLGLMRLAGLSLQLKALSH